MVLGGWVEGSDSKYSKLCSWNKKTGAILFLQLAFSMLSTCGSIQVKSKSTDENTLEFLWILLHDRFKEYQQHVQETENNKRVAAPSDTPGPSGRLVGLKSARLLWICMRIEGK